MNVSRRTRPLLAISAGIFAAALFFAAWAAPSFAADSLGSDVIAMFPKNMSEFAYADMKKARQLPWFSQLQQQMLPPNFREFEQFLRSAGVDPDTQIDELAWGQSKQTTKHPAEIVGIALGSFSPNSTEARFAQQKIPHVELHGYKLWAFGSGAGPSDIFFFFLDGNTAAFGQRDVLEQLVNVHFGSAESLLNNSHLYPLINSANGNGMIWAVLDKANTQLALHQLLPQAGQFPQASAILNRIRSMEIHVEAEDGADAKFNALCDSPEDANQLAAMLQGGIVLRRYQVQQSDPALAQALSNVSVNASGTSLGVDIPVTNDQLSAMIRERTFAMPAPQ